MQPDLFPALADNGEGAAARRVLAAFERTEGRWLDRIRSVARELYYTLGRPVCTDDLRAVMARHPELEPPRQSRNVMGAVFRGDWEWVDYTRSQVPGSHGNLIARWVPRDEAERAA